MCERSDDIDGRPGPIRAAMDWLTGRSDPGDAGPDSIGEEGLRAAEAGIRARELLRGRKLCRKCMCRLGDEPGETCGIIDRGVCWSCDSSWLEDKVLWPLIEALGHKASKRALKRLVRQAEEMAGE